MRIARVADELREARAVDGSTEAIEADEQSSRIRKHERYIPLARVACPVEGDIDRSAVESERLPKKLDGLERPYFFASGPGH